ncbi:MAG: hypothetical protein JNM56_40975 [Planctomycetia bacterium]|nr:hypothetical protein [Planctomycetia bacterium]
MRFALLGNHPDGIQMARALTASGRHEWLAYCGPKPGSEELVRLGLNVRVVGDLEEVLADPAVQLVIVAGKPGERPAQLRRALQSERPVLCVHPADESPDIAYEAGMIQGDTKQVLLPLLPDALSPPVRRLAELLRVPDGPLGQLRFVHLEHAAPGAVLLDADVLGHEPGLPCWPWLRTLGGEVVEVSAFAAAEEVQAGEPLLLAGRFQGGGLFQVNLLPNRARAESRLDVQGSLGTAELVLHGTERSGILRWQTQDGQPQEQTFETCDPWPLMVEVFEQASTAQSAAHRGVLSWQDAVRCLELDDAARRSVERRRASTLDFQEVSEEVGFKGTMTLVGCGLLWGVLFVVILAAWERRLLWLVVPLLLFFLGLQLLRWIIPQPPASPSPSPTDTDDRMHAG